MKRLSSQVQPSSTEFRENQARLRALCDELTAKLAVVEKGGPESARSLHMERGKLLAHERIDRVIDPARRFSNFRRWLPTGSTTTRPPGPASSPA